MTDTVFLVGQPVENRSTLEVGEIRMLLRYGWYLVAVDQKDMPGVLLDVWHRGAITNLLSEDSNADEITSEHQATERPVHGAPATAGV